MLEEKAKAPYSDSGQFFNPFKRTLERIIYLLKIGITLFPFFLCVNFI